MTAAERQYRQVLLQMERVYASSLSGETDWRSFESYALEILRWTNAIAASKVRYQAIRERIIDSEEYDLRDLLDSNEWLFEQDRALGRYMRERTAFVVATEKRFMEERGQFLDEDSLQRIIPHRFTMFYRNMVSDVLNLSAHTAATSDELAPSLPFMVYVTMKDERVRHTHAAMNGFVALTAHPIWKIIRPPCGYNCRCSLKLITLSQARRYGWLIHEKPLFSQKWPSRKARLNFAKKAFPDSGWHGPKEIARL